MAGTVPDMLTPKLVPYSEEAGADLGHLAASCRALSASV